jgi:uncharacterized small protein (DUF1192 family)
VKELKNRLRALQKEVEQIEAQHKGSKNARRSVDGGEKQ